MFEADQAKRFGPKISSGARYLRARLARRVNLSASSGKPRKSPSQLGSRRQGCATGLPAAKTSPLVRLLPWAVPAG
jgi:hypothetical protein